MTIRRDDTRVQVSGARGDVLPQAKRATERPSAVRVENVSFAYPRRPVFHGLDLEVERGKLFALVGPNGSGKSTLLRLVATLIPPDAGAISLFGHDAIRAARAARHLLGVVFQSPALDKKLTVGENLRYQGWLYGLHGSQLHRRIDEVLEIAGVADRAREAVGTLSGGLQRRVEIAKALLHRPRLLVLDEPTTGLDLSSRRQLVHYLRYLRDTTELTVLLTTHLLDEAEWCDEVAIMDGGRIVGRGTPRDLIEHVGGQVLWITTSRLRELAQRLRQQWQLEAQVIDNQLRVELPAQFNGKASQLLVEIVEQNPGAISSITLAQPTLEDVFIHLTGRRLSTSPPAEEHDHE